MNVKVNYLCKIAKHAFCKCVEGKLWVDRNLKGESRDLFVGSIEAFALID
jgi:hypothetical protein